MSADPSKPARPDTSPPAGVEGRAEVVRVEQGDKTIESRKLQDKFVSLPATLQPPDRRRAQEDQEVQEVGEREDAPPAPPVSPAEVVFPEVTFEVLRVPEALARSPYERWSKRLTEIREVSADIRDQLAGKAPLRPLTRRKKG